MPIIVKSHIKYLNNNMQRTISINFSKGSVKGDFYLWLFNKKVDFIPNRFSIRKSGKKWKVKNWKAKDIDQISDMDYDDSLSVSANEKLFTITETNTCKPHLSIWISQNDLFIDNEDIDKFLYSDGFTSAYLFDSIYVEVQSVVFESNIEGMGYPLDSIKNTPYKLDPYTKKKIFDTSFNPGRNILIGGTWIVAAWKMWFGEKFYDIIPKQHILSFPNAFQIQELKEGLIYIQLFENIEESDTEKNMAIQKSWLEWINIDELERLYP